MNFISCIEWVKKGIAKNVPDTINLDEDELKEIIEGTNTDNDNSDEEPPQATSEDEYDFKNYDNDNPLRVTLKGIATFDPVDKKSKKIKKPYKDDSDSEKEDELIQDDDNLLLVGHVDDDFNTLDIYVYNHKDNDMYIHHDLVLTSPPLCVEWLNIPSATESVNICAIGNMQPVIEIWDLDIINCVEPLFKLGRHKKNKPEKNFGHSDAVLSLAWNHELSHILASGSVDNKTLLWDLDSSSVSTEITSFTDKVQSLSWNPFNSHHLLVGCADQNLRNFDCRVYDQFHAFDLSSSVESIYWNPKSEHHCFAGTEDGNIFYIDWRMINQPVWQYQAHDKEVTGLAVHSNRANVLVSISTDETMKFWDCENELSLLGTKNLKLEALHCMKLNPEYPHIASVGGSSEKHGKPILKVVNLEEIINPDVTEPNVSVTRSVKDGVTRSKNENQSKPESSVENEFSIPLLEEKFPSKIDPEVKINKKLLKKKNVNPRRKEKQRLRRERFEKIRQKYSYKK